jgi:hypothetical protein
MRSIIAWLTFVVVQSWAGEVTATEKTRRTLAGIRTTGLETPFRSQQTLRRPPLGSRSSCAFLAEGEGFEPPAACTATVFKTAPLDHSGTLPYSLQTPL